MGKKTAVFFYKTIIAITLFCSVFVLAGTVGTARRSLFRKLDSQVTSMALLFLCAVMLGSLILVVFSMLDQWQEKQVKVYSLMAGITMLLVFCVFLCNFNPVPYTDAANVQEAALYFTEHPDCIPLPTDAPQARYYGKFANNNFLTVLYMYFFRFLTFIGIGDVQKPLHVAGTLGLLISAGLLYLTGVKIKGVRTGAKLLTLCVLNPLYYLLPLWPYTNVFCIPLMVGTVYFGICLYRAESTKRRILFGLAEAVCSVGGYLIRPVAVFPLIALIVCAVCRMLMHPKTIRHFIRCVLPCLIAGALFFQCGKMLNDKYFSSVSEENFPITHWLMMGAHGDGALNKDDVHFTLSFSTKEEKTEATLERMISYYQAFTLPEYASFWYKKLCTTWAQGDGGDLGRKISQDKKLTQLYQWIVGERSDAFRTYCFAYWLAVWFLLILILCRMLKACEIDGYSFVYVVTLFGGFLFYTFWEAKGSYSLPFLTVILPLAAGGADVISKNLSRYNDKLHDRHGQWIAGAVLGIAAIICIGGYQMMTTKEIDYRDWSVCNGSRNRYAANIQPDDPADEITQEFYAEKPFDHIRLGLMADEKAQETGDMYQMELLNEKGEAIYTSDIYANDVEKGWQVTLRIHEVVPKGREKYVLHLLKNPDNTGSMYFRRRPTIYLDAYDGRLFVNQEETHSDLIMSVWRKYKRTWCSKTAAVCLNGAVFAVSVLLVLCQYFRYEKKMEKRGTGGKE